MSCIQAREARRHLPRISCLIAPVFALALVATTAHATLISGTTSFTSTGSGVAYSNLLSTFSFNLSSGGSTTVNLLQVTPNSGTGSNTYNFTVTEDFVFTAPGTGSTTDLGTGTYSVTGHAINSGALTWADGTNGENITLSDGATVNINLSNVSFAGDDSRGGTPETVTATFTLTDPPPPIPEPSSLALLAAGLLTFAGVARLRRQPTR